jgi:hypothetical protein
MRSALRSRPYPIQYHTSTGTITSTLREVPVIESKVGIANTKFSTGYSCKSASLDLMLLQLQMCTQL